METTKMLLEIFFAILGVVLGLGLSLPFLAYVLAKKDIFWTHVDEGTAKIIMFNGAFSRVVMNHDGYSLTKKWEVVADSDAKATKPNWFGKKWQKYMGGIYWVGIYPMFQIHSYKFEWWKLLRAEDGKVSIKFQDGDLSEIFVKDRTYSFMLKDAETSENIQTNSVITFVIQITNPSLALFKAYQWFRFLLDTITPSPYIRKFYATNTFEDIRGKVKDKTASVELYEFLKGSPDIKDSNIIEWLQTNYGIFVKKANIEAFDASDPSMQIALAKKKLAELEAERMNILNGATNEKTIILRQLEVLEKIGEKAGKVLGGAK